MVHATAIGLDQNSSLASTRKPRDSSQSAAWFDVLVQPEREAVLLQAIGELDLAAIPRLREPADELLAAGFQQLVIDLRRLTFIDVSAVRLLLEMAVRARDDGWRLSLIQGGAHVRRMFALTKALGQLPFVDESAERRDG